MSESIDSLKDAEKEAMKEDSQPRRVRRNRGDIKGGLILIGIGTVFLVSQLTGWYLQNWWALFIFIPAIFQLNEAWQGYRENGRLNHDLRGSLFGGLLMSIVGAFFLFNISWNLFWPLILILVGISALLNGRS
jgi:hypothetical protein